MFDQIALCIRKIAEITREQIEKDRTMPEITECPKCTTPLQHASGIGDYCPNEKCDVVDGIMQAAGLVGQVRVVNRNQPTLKFKMLPGCPGLPEYKTAGAAGMDLRACILDEASQPYRYNLMSGYRALIKTGLRTEIPEGYALLILPRSGMALRSGVTVLNAPGLIDSDYRGELHVLLVNHGPGEFTINHGYRIAQAVLMPISRAQIVAVDELDETERGVGGFGSTGV